MFAAAPLPSIAPRRAGQPPESVQRLWLRRTGAPPSNARAGGTRWPAAANALARLPGQVRQPRGAEGIL
jgi:hypothetical protein